MSKLLRIATIPFLVALCALTWGTGFYLNTPETSASVTPPVRVLTAGAASISTDIDDRRTSKPASSTQPDAPPPATPRATEPQRDDSRVTVYITRTGERYHRGSCQYLRYSSIPVTLAEAKREGYTPCRVCKPAR